MRAEDLKARTAEVYEAVLKFIRVDPDGRGQFERVNESKAHRLKLVGKLTQRPPASLVRIAEQCKRVLRIERLGLLPRLRTLNHRPYARPPLDNAFRQRLTDAFREDASKLSNLVDRWSHEGP